MKKATATRKKSKAGSKQRTAGGSAHEGIAARSGKPGDWQSETLARIRAIIREADPEAVEEVKWRKPSNAMRGVPVWSHNGIICTGETYKSVVKMTFAKGASLADPAGLFNSSLDGNTRRAIDWREGETINEKALKRLIRDAVLLNSAALNTSAQTAARSTRSQKSAMKERLSGQASLRPRRARK